MHFACFFRMLFILLVQKFFMLFREGKAQNHMGTAFYTVVLENRRVARPPEGRLYMTSLASVPIDVTIVTSDMYDDVTKTLAPGETFLYKVAFRYHLKGSSFDYKGVYINSTGEITVQGYNMNDLTADGYLVIPVHSLSTNYHIMTYLFPDKSAHRQGPCMLAVVATQDETEVTLTFPKNNLLIRKPKGKFGMDFDGKTMTFTMHSQETLQLESSSDLTGTALVATSPVAVFAGALWTSVGHPTMGDHLVEQLPPHESWGKRFFVVPVVKRKTGDIIRILGKEKSTQVHITVSTNSKEEIILQESDYYDFTLPSDGIAQIESNQTILVAQFCKSYGADGNKNSDPFFSLVTPVEFYAPSSVFTTPVNVDPFESFLSIVAHRTSLRSIVFDGQPIDAQQFLKDWTPVPNTEFSHATIHVSSGRHTVIEFSRSSGLGLMLYGLAIQTSYGMPLGRKFKSRIVICNNGSMKWADYLDNDCDGLYDEEIANGKDDDYDGLIDEDIYDDKQRRLMPWEKPLLPTTVSETTEVTSVEQTTSDAPSTENELTTLFTTELSTGFLSTSPTEGAESTAEVTSIATERLTMKPLATTTLMWLITTSVSLTTDFPSTIADETTEAVTTEMDTTVSPTTELVSTEGTTVAETTSQEIRTKGIITSTSTLDSTTDIISTEDTAVSTENYVASTKQSTTLHATTDESSMLDSSSVGLTGSTELSSEASSLLATVTEGQNSPSIENITISQDYSTTDFGNFTNNTMDSNFLATESTTYAASKEEYNLLRDKPLIVVLPAAIIVGIPLGFVLYQAWKAFFYSFIRKKEEPRPKKKNSHLATENLRRTNKTKVVPNVVFDATADASRG